MQQENTTRLPDVPMWLVWVVAFYFVFYQIGSYPVLDNNEGLYAEIAREMLRSGNWHNWVIPHLNGLAYMEKPPLLYWLTAISFAVFGESEWAVRLLPALSCLACTALIIWFAKKINRSTAGKLAALIFVSGLGVTVMSRTLMFDMLLTFFLTAAVMAGYLFSEFRQRKFLYYSMIMLAFALLAKGFVALILFSAVIGSYSILRASSVKDFFSRLSIWFDWRGFLVFLIVALPWHLAAMIAEPIFAWFYFINEHVLRFLGRREPHDYYSGAWWYYLPRMLIFLFPWSFFLPVLLIVRRFKNIEHGGHVILLMAWLMPLLFFSVSSAKANYYLVATMPLAALQMGILLEEKIVPGSKWLLLPGILLIVLFGGLLKWSLNRPPHDFDMMLWGGMSGGRFVFFSLLILLAVSVLAMLIAYKAKLISIFAYLLIPVFLLPILLEVVKATSEYSSTKGIVNFYLTKQADRELILFKVFEQQSSLPFYMKKPIKVLNSRSSDLFWGNKLHDNSIVINDHDFKALSLNSKLSVLVMKQDIPDFERADYASQFKLVRQLGNTAIFSN